MPYGSSFDQKSEWEKSESLPIGGKWSYKVGIIKDASGVRKVRVAKCELKDDGKLSEVQKLNIKRVEEWERIVPVVRKYLEEVDVENQLGKKGTNAYFRRTDFDQTKNESRGRGDTGTEGP